MGIRAALRWALISLSLCGVVTCRRPHRAPAKPPPRYVFIDGGAHIGETVLAFEKSALYAKHPWSVVSFEPNPTLVPLIPKRPYLTVLEQAIWTKDEKLVFQFSEVETLGGSVLPTVVKLPQMKSLDVKAIDFGQWLRRTYSRDDVVYVKFDIEGAEYPVLEQMLRDGSIAWIDKLYVEFHGVQQAEADHQGEAAIKAVQKKDYELVEAITGAGVTVSLHLTDEPQGSYFGFDPEKYGQKW